MPSGNDAHDTTGGLNSTYYQNDSAQASSTTVPLVFRTSGSNIYPSSDRDEVTSIQSSGRNSELYNDLLDEVRKPNMPSDKHTSEDSDTLPPSLRVANTQRPTGDHPRSNSKRSNNGMSGSRKPSSRGRNDGPEYTSRKGSKRSPGSAPRDSLQPRGSDRKRSDASRTASGRSNSKQSRRPAGGDTQRGQTLPTSTYRPNEAQNRGPVDSKQYKAYRPSAPGRKPSRARDPRSKSTSRKPVAAAAIAGGMAAGAAAAYAADSAHDPSSLAAGAAGEHYDGSGYSPTGDDRVMGSGFDRGSPLSPLPADSPPDFSPVQLNDPSMDHAGQTSFDYPDEPLSPGQDRGMPASADVVSPFDDRFSRAGFDNSTPGSPHDSPIDIQNSPIGSFMPQGDFPGSGRNSIDGLDGDDAFNGSRDIHHSPTRTPLEGVSPSSSFGGSEFAASQANYTGDNGLAEFSPNGDPSNFDPNGMDRGLALSPKDDFATPKGSFQGDTRSVSLSDAGPDYTDEKGGNEDFEEPKPLWKRPIVFIIAGVVAVLIIIAIAVGIAFAVKNKGKSNVTNNNQTTTNTPTQNTPVLGGFKTQDPALVNNAFVMTGTNMNTVTVSGSNGGSNKKRQNTNSNNVGGTNFLNFYQHSTGEIRMASWQNSNFQPSSLVVTDSHSGTPIAAYSRTDIVMISVFYFNKDKILQEVRSQDGVNWQPGTIGKLGLTSDAPSDLTVEYVGACGGSGLAWLAFHTGVNDQTNLIYWNQATDTWTQSGGFPGVKQGAGFQGQSDADAWRFYYVSSQNSQLSQMVCPGCCKNPKSPSWKPGINGPPVTSATGGVTVVNAGSPRMIYYQDADGTVRELNNTGKYPNEVYMMNVAPSRRGNTGVAAPNNAPTGPVGSPVAQVLPESRMGVAAGFRDSIPQLWLFAQTNITGISLVLRNVDVVGQWTTPIPIPVGS